MTNQTIDSLLALDPTRPDEALELRIGIARLAGWTEIEHIQLADFVERHDWIGREPGRKYGKNSLPPFEASLDAAVTLLDGLFWNLYGTPPIVKADNPFRCELARNALGFHSKMELHEDAETPALAVCRAWLSYQQRISARRDTERTEE